MALALFVTAFVASVLALIEPDDFLKLILFSVLLEHAIETYKKIRQDPRGQTRAVRVLIRKWYKLLIALGRSHKPLLKLIGKFLFVVEKIVDGILAFVCLSDEIQDEINEKIHNWIGKTSAGLYLLLVRCLLHVVDYVVHVADYTVHKLIHVLDCAVERILQSVFYALGLAAALAVLLLYIFSPFILYNIQGTPLIPDMSISETHPRIDSTTLGLLLIFVAICSLPKILDSLTITSARKRSLTYTSLADKEPPYTMQRKSHTNNESSDQGAESTP
jgi:hypothetical protein